MRACPQMMMNSSLSKKCFSSASASACPRPSSSSSCLYNSQARGRSRSLHVVSFKPSTRQTQVVLSEAVVNLGSAGDIVNVKPGYFRNYLLPYGKAKRATKEVLQQVQVSLLWLCYYCCVMLFILCFMIHSEIDSQVTICDKKEEEEEGDRKRDELEDED